MDGNGAALQHRPDPFVEEPRTPVTRVRVRVDFSTLIYTFLYVPSPHTQPNQLITLCISGDRKFKIPVLDPLFITEMQATSQDFEGAIYNSTAVGFKDFNVERVG